MSIGLLLIINFLAVLFLYEAETLGCSLGKFPKIIDILKLKTVLRARWLKFYFVFLAIFFVIVLAPSRSGKSYSVGLTPFLLICFIQVCLWVGVIFKIRKSKK